MTKRFLFVMLLMMSGAVWLRGAGFARQSNATPQPTPSQSGQKTVSDQLHDSNSDRQVQDEKHAGNGDEDRALNSPAHGTSHVTQPRPNQSRTTLAPRHQARPGKTPVASGLLAETLEDGIGFHQTGSTRSSGVPNRTVNPRSVSVPPPTVAVNGQQFKSSRDPGARLASSGGPLAATRGTAAINGTNMKRKP